MICWLPANPLKLIRWSPQIRLHGLLWRNVCPKERQALALSLAYEHLVRKHPNTLISNQTQWHLDLALDSLLNCEKEMFGPSMLCYQCHDSQMWRRHLGSGIMLDWEISSLHCAWPGNCLRMLAQPDVAASTFNSSTSRWRKEDFCELGEAWST